MVDDYHRDHGEGADLYSAGKSRGCGGNGVWDGGRLYPSANFTGTRVLANGPLRVMFELTYPAWQANGRSVSELNGMHTSRGLPVGCAHRS
jgi:pectinesterase